MVRQDKITYLITSFNSEGWLTLPKHESILDFLNKHVQSQPFLEDNMQFINQDKYLSDEDMFNQLCDNEYINTYLAQLTMCCVLDRNILPIDDTMNRILSRLGIVSKNQSNEYVYSKIGKYIPVKRSKFLHSNLIKLIKIYCVKEHPNCLECFLQKHCDFSQEKNEWGIEH